VLQQRTVALQAVTRLSSPPILSAGALDLVVNSIDLSLNMLGTLLKKAWRFAFAFGFVKLLDWAGFLGPLKPYFEKMQRQFSSMSKKQKTFLFLWIASMLYRPLISSIKQAMMPRPPGMPGL
jgi:hypothetical protein